MGNTLSDLSDSIAAAVERAGRSVVVVNGRERLSSSGVHWSPGVVVTAEHTVRRNEDIRIGLADGRTIPATLAGRDAGTDLAVLKTELPDLAVAERRNGTPRAGEIALVVGRGSESGTSAAMGIVSAVGGAWRTWRGGLLESYIRLDASIYPGNSGGTVVDAEGRVFGIATGGLSRVAPVAIPGGTVERIVGELLAHGRVARGYLGVGLQPVAIPDHLRSKLGLGQAAGLIVLGVEPASPAADAGALIGDILVALDGKSVTDTDDVQAVLTGEAIGRAVRVAVVRGGESREIVVTVRERPGRSA